MGQVLKESIRACGLPQCRFFAHSCEAGHWGPCLDAEWCKGALCLAGSWYGSAQSWNTSSYSITYLIGFSEAGSALPLFRNFRVKK